MKKKGFTLVETLAVLAIISVILILAVPTITSIGNKMKVNMKDKKLELLKSAAYSFVLSNKKYCKENNIASTDKKYYECNISVETLVNKGGYKRDLGATNKCSVFSPDDNSCMDKKTFTVRVNKNGNGGSVVEKPTDTPKPPATEYIKKKIEIEEADPTKPEPIIEGESPADGSCTNTFAYDGTSDANLRYVGKNPCNYVKFNNELWRIIGVMNNVDDGTGKKESRLKIIRDESLGKYSWDSSAWDLSSNSGSVGYGINDWTQADLMKELNSDYLNTSLTANKKWYNGLYDKQEGIFDYKKALNSDSKNLISEAKWNLGGYFSPFAGSGAFYSAERGSQVFGNPTGSGGGSCNGEFCPRKTSWIGKVALAYPSDYGFAVGGNRRSDCLTASLGSFYDYSCDSNSWMGKILSQSNGEYMFLLTPQSMQYQEGIFAIYPYEHKLVVVFAAQPRNVNPTVYLKSNVTISSGDGTKNNPYTFDTSTDTTTPETLVDHIESLVSGEPNNSTNVITKTAPDSTCTNTLAYDRTSDNNLRYVDKSPCNYVKFNDELWRIIGVMNNVDDGTGKKESKVKLIRNNSLGSFSWDSSSANINQGHGKNDWTQADLMNELNGKDDYLNYKSTGTKNWYDGTNKRKLGVFNQKDGLKTESKKLIGNSVWYLGGEHQGGFGVDPGYNASQSYSRERSNLVFGVDARPDNGYVYPCTDDSCPRATEWTGKVALLYPSDFGFAIGGSSRTNCLERKLEGHTTDTSCYSKNWFAYLQPVESYETGAWTLTPDSLIASAGNSFSCGDVSSNTLCMISSGRHASSSAQIYPSIYLKSDVLYKGGVGSKSNPYLIDLS